MTVCNEVYDEGSSVTLSFTFNDKDGNPQVPTTVTYRVDCDTTKTEIVDDTTIAAASTVEITVNGSLNEMQDNNNDFEKKIVTVLAEYGSGDQIVAQEDYMIKNLPNYPFPIP